MGYGQSGGGFSLIEVLVATSLFSFGMGGMAALMLAAAGGMSESQHATVAYLGADAMAATLQLSPIALEHLENPSAAGAACFEVEGCTAEAYTLGQYTSWRVRMSQQLPGGAGVVCRDGSINDGTNQDPACDGTGPTVVKVFWQEPRRAHDADQGHRRATVHVPK